MPDAHIEEERLHHYVDGELKPAAAQEVATHLSQCGDCSARLSELRSLHDGVTAMAEESARDVDFDAVFQRIEAGIARENATTARERSPGPIPLRHPRRSARVWASAAGLLAAAAAVLLFFRGELGLGTGHPENGNIEIEQVAFNDDYGGTVFEVAVADGVSTKVVWINDYYDDDDDAEEAIQ